MSKVIFELELKADKTLSTLKQINEEIKATSKSLEKQKIGTKAYTDQEKALTKLKDTKRALTSITKDEQKAAASLDKQRQRGLAAMAKQEAKEKQLIATSKMTATTYEQMSKKMGAINVLRKREDLSTKKGAANYRKMTAEVNKLNASLKRMDKQGGTHSRNVGQYFQKAYVASAAAIMGVVMALRRLSRGLTTFINFSATMSQVEAVSGATDKQMQALTKTAKELGSTTKFTATEVANLQLNLSKKGFSVDQIEAATAGITELAIATGEDLAASADIAAGVMNAFGLAAADSGMLADLMAKSFSESALNLDKFQLGMSKVAPVAKLLNLPIQQVTANLATLVDANVDAGTASAQLRNILITLNEKGMTLEEGMLELSKSTDIVGEANALFGKRAAPIAAILATNIEKTDQLTKSFGNAEGSAKRMSDIMKDNLKGDTLAAKSALEGLAIAIGESQNGGLRNVVQGFTKGIQNAIKNIEKIITAVRLVIKFIIAYTVATKLYTLAQKSATRAGEKFTFSLKGVKSALKGMKASLAASGFGILLIAITEAVIALAKFIKEQRAVGKAVAETSKQIETEKRGMNALFEQIKKTNEGSQKRSDLIKELNDRYGDYITYQIDENSNLEAIEASQRSANDELARSILLKNRDATIVKETEKYQKRQQKEFDALVRNLEKVGYASEDAYKIGTKLWKGLKDGSIQLNNLGEVIGDYTLGTETYSNANLVLNDVIRDFGFTIDGVGPKQAKFSKIVWDFNQAIKDETAKLNEVNMKFDAYGNAIGLTAEELAELERLEDERSKKQKIRDAQIAARKQKEQELLDKQKDAEEAAADAANKYNEALKKINEEYKLNIFLANQIEDSRKRQIALIEAEKTQINSLLSAYKSVALANDGIYDEEEQKQIAAYTKQIEDLEKSMQSWVDVAKDAAAADPFKDYVKKSEEMQSDIAGNFDGFSFAELLFSGDAEAIQAAITRYEEFMGQYGDLAKSGLAAINEIWHNSNQGQIEAIDKRLAKSNEYYDNLIANADGDEERQKQLNSFKEREANKLHKQKVDIERKEAKAAKAAGMLSVAISTASAIIGALSPLTGLGTPAGIPFSIAAGITGALQMAAIASQPLPQYHTGGYTGDGGKYEPKGVVHGGEVVFSKKDVQILGGASIVDSMRPTSTTTNNYYTGGIVGFSNAANTQTQSSDVMFKAISRIRPVVTVEDINAGVNRNQNRTKVSYV